MNLNFKVAVIAFSLLFIDSITYCQGNMLADIPNRDPNDPVYKFVEKMPQLPGGNEEILQYTDYYPYPACGLDHNIQGKVIIQFIVEKDGSLSDIKVMRSPHQCLSDAAIDYLQHWPLWEPGQVNNKAVSCLFTLPIDYNIDQYNNRPK